MIQTIIVILAVVLAGGYILRRTLRQAKGSGGCGCGSGCGCSSGNGPKPVDILDSIDNGPAGPDRRA